MIPSTDRTEETRDEPVYWFVLWESAVERGDYTETANAATELHHLGTRVTWANPRRKARWPVPDTARGSATQPPPADLAALLSLLRDRLAPAAELLTRETFAVLLDIGTSTFDKLRETGAIGPRPIRLAGLKWPRDEALAWLRHRGPDGELHDAQTWPAVWESVRRRAEK